MKAIERMNGIPTRILGRTGLRVTVLCVGGYHIGKDRDPKLGVGIIRTAISYALSLPIHTFRICVPVAFEYIRSKPPSFYRRASGKRREEWRFGALPFQKSLCALCDRADLEVKSLCHLFWR